MLIHIGWLRNNCDQQLHFVFDFLSVKGSESKATGRPSESSWEWSRDSSFSRICEKERKKEWEVGRWESKRQLPSPPDILQPRRSSGSLWPRCRTMHESFYPCNSHLAESHQIPHWSDHTSRKIIGIDTIFTWCDPLVTWHARVLPQLCMKNGLDPGALPEVAHWKKHVDAQVSEIRLLACASNWSTSLPQLLLSNFGKARPRRSYVARAKGARTWVGR
jgi:hypothetical protein